MKFFKYSLLVLSILYFISRLYNLKIIPIFTDEAIYSYWAQIALHDPVNRFISLEDGKQPLFIWLGAISQKFYPDPLIALRLVSVFSGFGSLIAIYLLTRALFNQRTAFVAASMYIILPFTLLYDRMGLFDSLLTMLGLFSAYIGVLMAKAPKLHLALLNGLVIGLALINKSSANLFFFLLPFSYLFLNINNILFKKKLLYWIVLTVVTGFISQLFYNSLRISPLFYMIGRKNQDFIRSFSEITKNPLIQIPGNPKSLFDWLVEYNGWPFIAFAFLTIVWGVYKKKPEVFMLVAYFFLPFLAESIFNKVLYPRFALFYFPYLIIIVAYGLLSFKQKISWAFLLVTFLIFTLPIYSSFKLLTDPPGSMIPNADKEQFFNSWPAGYGISQIVDYLALESKNGKVVVGTEGTFGLLPFAIQIYFYANPNVQITGYWPVRDIPQQVLDAANDNKTYFIFNENQKISDNTLNPHLKLISKFKKGTGDSYMRFFEIIE